MSDGIWLHVLFAAYGIDPIVLVEWHFDAASMPLIVCLFWLTSERKMSILQQYCRAVTGAAMKADVLDKREMHGRMVSCMHCNKN